MSLSTSLDEWLKQPPMSASAADDFAGSLAGDLPDLGLNLTPEDIKWVDLEFLDLASGPPANHHGSAATRLGPLGIDRRYKSVTEPYSNLLTT